MPLGVHSSLDVASLGVVIHDQGAPWGGAMRAPWGRIARDKGCDHDNICLIGYGGFDAGSTRKVRMLDQLCSGVG